MSENAQLSLKFLARRSTSSLEPELLESFLHFQLRSANYTKESTTTLDGLSSNVLQTRLKTFKNVFDAIETLSKVSPSTYIKTPDVVEYEVNLSSKNNSKQLQTFLAYTLNRLQEPISSTAIIELNAAVKEVFNETVDRLTQESYIPSDKKFRQQYPLDNLLSFKKKCLLDNRELIEQELKQCKPENMYKYLEFLLENNYDTLLSELLSDEIIKVDAADNFLLRSSANNLDRLQQFAVLGADISADNNFVARAAIRNADEDIMNFCISEQKYLISLPITSTFGVNDSLSRISLDFIEKFSGSIQYTLGDTDAEKLKDAVVKTATLGYTKILQLTLACVLKEQPKKLPKLINFIRSRIHSNIRADIKNKSQVEALLEEFENPHMQPKITAGVLNANLCEVINSVGLAGVSKETFGSLTKDECHEILQQLHETKNDRAIQHIALHMPLFSKAQSKTFPEAAQNVGAARRYLKRLHVSNAKIKQIAKFPEIQKIAVANLSFNRDAIFSFAAGLQESSTKKKHR